MVRVTVYATITVLIFSMMFRVVTSSSLPPEAESCVRVPQDYATIQEAVNAVGAGDTVLVSAGVYYENLIINKSISLMGQDNTDTIINGNGIGNVILVVSDNANISGFTIKNGDAGIFINSSNVTVDGNIVKENGRSPLTAGGIFLNYSFKSKICANTIVDNGGSEPGYMWGDGIACLKGSQNTISDNLIVNNVVGGINLLSDFNIVERNTLLNNNMCGVIIGSSNHNRIANNIIQTNRDTGIRLDGSSCNLVRENEIFENGFWDIFGPYPQGGGIFLMESVGNIIEKNVVHDNVNYGFYTIDRNPDNVFRENTVLRNRLGIYFHNSDNSTVYHNNFINNGVQASVGDAYPDIEFWDNGAEGNYWSNFTGSDSNLDGIIDEPYVLDVRNSDNFPLVEPWSEVRTYSVIWDGIAYNVTTSCKSTIAAFSFSQPNKQVSFNVTGRVNSTANCNVTLPLSLMWGYFSVLINDVPQPYAIYQNTTHTSIYFAAPFHSMNRIKILSTGVVSETPVPTLAIIITAITTILVLRKRKTPLKPPTKQSRQTEASYPPDSAY